MPGRRARRTARGVPRAVAAAAALTLAGSLTGALAGCVVVTSGGERPPAPAPEETSQVPVTGTVELRGTPGDLPTVMAAATRSLLRFWRQELPAVYDRPFRDLAGGIQAKTERSAPWTCGGQRFTFEDIRGNAFYCGGPDDDYIAYDAVTLLPRLNEVHGALTPAVVLAHEMGHAVQARVAVDAPSVVRELQADCFAGAWVAWAQGSEDDQVAVDDDALDASVRAIPALRDQPGTAATNPRAHGLGFDRVNAYQVGYEEGVARCATFPQGDVVVTELPFRTVAEAQSGGNLPYAETVEFAVGHLQAFWPEALPQLVAGSRWQDPEAAPVPDGALPACPGDEAYDAEAVAAYCGPANTVAWSDPTLARVHARLGDVAAAAALSLAWARAAQVQGRAPDAGPAADLQQVCLTGAWLASIASGQDADVSLSPGDVDEALFAVLTPLSPRTAEDVRGASFERTDALRTGLLGGITDCLG